MTVTVPPLSVHGLEGHAAVAERKSAPPLSTSTLPAAARTSAVGPRSAPRPGQTRFAQVTFAYRPVGTTDWQQARHRRQRAVPRSSTTSPACAKGTLVEYRAVAQGLPRATCRRPRRTAWSGTPTPAGGGGGGAGPVTQPANVSVPGSHNTEMGCPGDWQPDCDQAQLALDPKDKIWKGTVHLSRPANYAYKAAINKTWDENYGAGGVPNGANISYTAPGGTGHVLLRPRHALRHLDAPRARSSRRPAASRPSSAAGGDWDPACMRPWLQDPDGDGIYTWSGTKIPAGNYEFKVAHGLGWDENYGAGGTAERRQHPVHRADGRTVADLQLRPRDTRRHDDAVRSRVRRPT